MEDLLAKEIQRMKAELSRRKEELGDIERMIRRDIDRSFEIDPWDLSEREMEMFIRENLPPVKDNIDIHPDSSVLKSHRKIFGRPVIGLKRRFMKMIDFYTRLFADKQTEYNRRNFALLQAALLRSRRNQERLKAVEERLGQCEERLVVILVRLEDLARRTERRKDAGDPNENPIP